MNISVLRERSDFIKFTTHRTRSSNKPKVLVVSDAAPYRNGVGAYYQDLLEHLSDDVGAIEVLSPEIIDGQWQGGLMLPLPGDATQKFCIPNLRTLKRRIDEFAPDVIISPTPGPFGMYGARYASKTKTRLLVGFHTWYEKLCQLYGNRVQGVLSKGYFEITNRLIFQNAYAVLGNSQEMVNIARRLGAQNPVLMGTPVSKPFIETPIENTPKASQRILFAGRLATEKNIDAILSAARALPSLSFTIAGDGPARDMVEHSAQLLPNLNYLGWVKREALLRLMDQHDTLVLPSKVESFGTIAMEAMARQRLVVVSEQCGIADWDALAKRLITIPHDRSLAHVLRDMSQYSEFTIASKAIRAREAVLAHNQWNKDLWLRLINPEVSVSTEQR